MLQYPHFLYPPFFLNSVAHQYFRPYGIHIFLFLPCHLKPLNTQDFPFSDPLITTHLALVGALVVPLVVVLVVALVVALVVVVVVSAKN